MSILAIDFGEKRLGLAISSGFVSQPLKVLSNNKKIFENLKKICREFSVEKIILGIPEGRLVSQILEFGKNCQEILGIEVVFENEILTTKEASKLLIEAKKKVKKRKKSLDAAAAAVILQQYLDRLLHPCSAKQNKLR